MSIVSQLLLGLLCFSEYHGSTLTWAEAVTSFDTTDHGNHIATFTDTMTGDCVCGKTGTHHSTLTRTDTPREPHTHLRQTHVHTHKHVTHSSVVFVALCLRVFTVAVRRGPAPSVRLAVILLIGPRWRGAQRAGFLVLNSTLDLHLPLLCLDRVGLKNMWVTGQELTEGLTEQRQENLDHVFQTVAI